jgi:hypothetical protein
VASTARQSAQRPPCRSTSGPISGESRAAQSPPSEAAPEIAVRDHPNSRLSGSTKTENVAVAPPWRANPAQHRLKRTTQPYANGSRAATHRGKPPPRNPGKIFDPAAGGQLGTSPPSTL